MNTWTTGILIALVLAGGVWLMLSAARAVGAPSFADRIAPQLRMVQVNSAVNGRGEVRASKSGGSDAIGPVVRQTLIWATEKIAPFTGSVTVLERRLVRAGLDKSVVDYRAEQVVFAVLGVLLGSVFSIGLVLQGSVSVAIVLVGAVLGAFCGVWCRDFLLKQRIAKREKLMLAEFPAVAELMALSVGAGESAVGALERVCRVAEGELVDEFRQVLAQTRAGSGLVTALQDFSSRTDVIPLGRFVDGIIVAIERGTPLAEVLRAQAQDVRDHDKRVLMEIAGKKEIAMLIPVVFFVLPLSVVFAVFPGLAVLEMGF
ncbi:type II secretion system F family protein [Kocuria sp. cx-116]|uniref:type II secretion system F family protein n=1 Tax=Kocuria sp. cx-116 TaxID=2771378 RepID=UPI0016864D1F|nr:type II secretion system F family protein [Kocuria sp. cx-116]MBD2761052.1 type II secretion system F family protein [Kocuria sp. cx-116]